jgi:hypothetical protein
MIELSPVSTTPRLEQYRLAWHALTSPGCSDDKLHAKCWLTYRTFDGEVKYDDWKRLIEPVPAIISTLSDKTRWEVSISTAEYYLAIIHCDDIGAAAALGRINSQDLSLWPGCLLNFCRVNAIHAHAEMISGNKAACITDIQRTIRTWQSVISNFDPMAHPVRFIEAYDDLRALHMLILLAQEIGALTVELPNREWVHFHKIAIQQCDEPWAKCIRHITIKK